MDRTTLEQQERMLEKVLMGNREAIEFIEILAHASQVWDDLVDQDKEVAPESANRMMMGLLVGLPRNGFWNRWCQELQPAIEQAIIDWHTANVMEGERDHARTIAFVLRDNLASVIIRAAAIIGGIDWAIKVSPEVRGVIHDEPLHEYLESLT